MKTIRGFSRLATLATIVVLACGLSCPAEEGEAYFSLSSSRTYAPGATPTIDVWSRNLNTLEFRVYKVNDPVRFFENLQDLHTFGARAPQVPHTETAIERFHHWKHGIFARIRDFVRAQFTAESRANIRNRMAEQSRQPVQGAEIYAQVPLINKQQVVAVWRQPIPTVQRWESATVPVPVSEKGVYLVEATNGQLRAYTIVVIDEMAIVVKTAPGKVLAFVVDRRGGAPMADCAVMVWANRKSQGEAQTDKQGLAALSINEQRPENVLVLARKGKTDDFAASAPSGYNLGTDPATSLVGYIYTDRPVYRPGDTMHYKAILRTHLGPQYQLPEKSELQLQIRDAEYKVIAQKSVTASDIGTVRGDFTVPANASLGNYTLQIGSGETTANGTFFVEEYKKPEYEVRVTPEKKRVLQGEPIKATIDAKYYFGEPVAGAKVTYVAHVARFWTWGYPEDEEAGGEGGDEGGDASEDDSFYGGEQQMEATGKLDADGRLQISIPTAPSPKKYDLTYRIEARVTDSAGREIPGHGFVLATYGSFRVSIRPDSYVYEPGGVARLQVRASDYDNKPIATAFHIEVHTWQWSTAEHTGRAIFSADGKTDASGEAEMRVPLASGGSFKANVTAQTPENREVEESTWLWVQGGSSAWMGEQREQIRIVPDKKQYKPGDVAKVLIAGSGGSARMLVTTEGSDLYSSQVVTATRGSSTVSIPIKTEYAPNFYVSAVFLRDDKLHSGTKSLKVPPDEHALKVELQPSKPQYRPGEAAVYSISAHDADGKPVSAEFSVGVVDEAIYAIHPEIATDILKFFYGTVYNRVGTESSLTYFFQGEAGKRQMQLTAVHRSRGLAQIKPERLVQPKVRKAFPDTAYWMADVRTDASGHAQVRFDFPDALTAWRATTRGVTKDTKVGAAVERVIVRKDLMVRLAVPRFFRQGDEVVISAIVHNYLTRDKTARVSLDLTGLQPLQGSTQDVTVASRGEAKIDWRVKADRVREARVLAKALTDEESDAMELTLPVIPYGVKLAIPRSGSVPDGSGEQQASVAFPVASEATSRSLQISVTPSIAGTIFGALEYLTSYPWGCTEQTMSSFLPNIIVARATKELGLKSTVDAAALEKKINAGLDRLYDFQHEDGGWGWWQTDDSHVFMTAYVLAGLSQAHEAGYTIRDGVIDRARVWLKGDFDRDPRIVADLRAYMAYSLVLSGTRDAAMIDSVWKQRGDLTPYGAALLGLTINATGDARADELASQLERQATTDEQTAHWSLDHDPLMGYYGDATPQATAYALKLLARLRPQSPLLPKAALWLASHRDEGYYWESTEQTAMVVYGLTDYLKQSGELKPDFTVEVFVNDKSVLMHRYTPADALSTSEAVITLNADQLAPTDNVRIRKTGTGRLYWSVRGEYFSDAKSLVNSGSFSLNLAREYFRLSPAQQDNKIVYQMDRLSGPVHQGDILAVRLTVSGSDWRYLMIEDPIPAGTEFIQSDELYEIAGGRPAWWGAWFSRREFHDDRAAFFQTYFFRGQGEFKYLLKVVNPGLFRVSPARVEPMYQPQYRATSDAQQVDVK